MAKVELIRVFVSSPGDMTKERELVTTIANEMNTDIGQIHNFRIEPILWETHSASEIGDRSQNVINSQMDEYEIYLGIMGNKFGSSTGPYGSGTEEEFAIALRKHRVGDINSIQFYFSDESINPSSLDLAQFEKAKAFKKLVGESGVLYRSYQDLIQFRYHCRKGLYEAIKNILRLYREGKETLQQEERKPNKPHERLRNLKYSFSQDPYVSSHILSVEAARNLRRFQEYMEKLTKNISDVSSSLEKLARMLTSANSGKKINENRLINQIERALEKIEEFIYNFSESILEMDEAFATSISALQRAAQVIDSSESLGKDGIRGVIEASGTFIQHLAQLKEAALTSSQVFLDAFKDGDRFIGAGRTFRATTLDFAEFLDKAVKS
jgi:hypothetical protein